MCFQGFGQNGDFQMVVDVNTNMIVKENSHIALLVEYLQHFCCLVFLQFLVNT